MSYTIDKSTERLMPHGWCWNGARIGSIKEMTDGLSVQIDRDRIEGQNIIRDYFPQNTTFIEEWENILALPLGLSLTDQQRRDRIEAARSSYPVNTFSGQASFINLSGFNIKCIPLEPAQDPNTLTRVLEVIGDGRYSGLGHTFTLPEGPADPSWTLLYIIENIDGSIIDMTQDEYNALRFLILKAKPVFMWCIVRGNIIYD